MTGSRQWPPRRRGDPRQRDKINMGSDGAVMENGDRGRTLAQNSSGSGGRPSGTLTCCSNSFIQKNCCVLFQHSFEDGNNQIVFGEQKSEVQTQRLPLKEAKTDQEGKCFISSEGQARRAK